MNAIAKEAATHFELAANESKPLADVILPGTADYRSQEPTLRGMRYMFGPGALAYTDRALKTFCGASTDEEARVLIERHADGVVLIADWEEL